LLKIAGRARFVFWLFPAFEVAAAERLRREPAAISPAPEAEASLNLLMQE